MTERPSDKYADFLPPLSSEEFAALKADIDANGVLHPVMVDEDGNVLDGRHRLKINPGAPRKVIRGLSAAEKEAFVFRANFVRRNLSPSQKDEARRRMKETAKRLREEDAKKWTQKRVAETLGVTRQTVDNWFNRDVRTKATSGNGTNIKIEGENNPNRQALRCGVCGEIFGDDIPDLYHCRHCDHHYPINEECSNCHNPGRKKPDLTAAGFTVADHIKQLGEQKAARKPQPDARVKINPAKKPEIAAAVKAGKSQAQVAADIGVSQKAVSNVVREEAKKAEIKEQRAESAKKRDSNCGVICGDFRIGAAAIEDESIDLIFTDPPYDEKATVIYQDIARLAATKLLKGGWLCAYTGQAHLPAVMKAFSETEGLIYAWTFCVVHSGGDLRFRKFKIQNGWKPIVAAFKPPLQVDWDWFKDVASGGKEKSDHPWQQALSEASHFIERLCPRHGLVFDPCCGSGTSLAASKSLSRKWLGYEIDPEHADTARSRIEQTPEPKK